VSAPSSLPRRFGNYLLTEELGEDALGAVFRALRTVGERSFVRLRIFESPEISEDALLDAIEESGEIHSLLKNPAIARGVQMDTVEGIPFLCWNEANGRTLDALVAKARDQRTSIPVEHALLIGEKVATALEHAYNTTLDGERTLHGLVWPGFVSISDDGETRLTGFGLAPGFFPSMAQPRFAREIAPYLAPEERAGLTIAKNSDVYSVGVLLFEMLFRRLPSAVDPLADIRSANPQAGGIPPEAMSVLRTCLSPAESRYQSSGDLRRELGKLLFSGPYSPSTFNLAFFLTGLFGVEIESENRRRVVELAWDASGPEPPKRSAAASPTPASQTGMARDASRPRQEAGGRGRSVAIGGGLLLAAAVAGTIFVISRRPASEPPHAAPTASPLPVTRSVSPVREPTSPPTTGMNEAQFKEEVARRVAAELKRLEEEARSKPPAAPPRPVKQKRSAPAEASEAEPSPEPGKVAEAQIPTANVPTARAPEPVEPTPVPARDPGVSAAEERPTASVEAVADNPEEGETPPRILRIVKPVYPEVALRARIRGLVLLRVLVTENGSPEQIQVVRGAAGGLTEAAVSAVRRWTFEPGRRNGQPVRAWTTVPIPFEP
jgi:TonB family protein